jgi:hypothetical protein
MLPLCCKFLHKRIRIFTRYISVPTDHQDVPEPEDKKIFEIRQRWPDLFMHCMYARMCVCINMHTRTWRWGNIWNKIAPTRLIYACMDVCVYQCDICVLFGSSCGEAMAYVHILIHVCTDKYICMLCMYVFMHSSICIHTHTHTHTHTHIPPQEDRRA